MTDIAHGLNLKFSRGSRVLAGRFTGLQQFGKKIKTLDQHFLNIQDHFSGTPGKTLRFKFFQNYCNTVVYTACSMLETAQVRISEVCVFINTENKKKINKSYVFAIFTQMLKNRCIL